MTETALVTFHGQQLLTIKDGDTIRVAMRPICEAIGLDWSAQFRRIERHPVLGATVAMMATVAASLPAVAGFTGGEAPASPAAFSSDNDTAG